MKGNYVDVNTMSGIIKNMDTEKQQLYMNLYKNYNLLYNNYNLKEQKINSLDVVDSETKRKISELENKIYTVNGKVLTQKERVILELKNIFRFLSKNGDRVPDKVKTIVSKELTELDSMIKKNGLFDNDIIKYLKKRISILQAYLGMNIKFFNEALEVFDEQILVTRINKNTGLDSHKTR